MGDPIPDHAGNPVKILPPQLWPAHLTGSPFQSCRKGAFRCGTDLPVNLALSCRRKCGCQGAGSEAASNREG